MPLNNVAKIAKKNEMSFTVLKSVAVAVLLTYKTSRFKIKFKRPGQLQDLKSTAVHECQFSERFETASSDTDVDSTHRIHCTKNLPLRAF